MIVVADTGPLNYLVLIDVVNILEPLYKRVLIPSAVADELRADDDSKGQAEAERRHLKVTGTLGVIAAAHRRGLLDFEAAIASLSWTTLYLSPRLLETIRRLM